MYAELKHFNRISTQPFDSQIMVKNDGDNSLHGVGKVILKNLKYGADSVQMRKSILSKSGSDRFFQLKTYFSVKFLLFLSVF